MKKIFLFILFLISSLFAQTNNLISPSNFKASFEALESLKILEGYRAYVYYDNNQNIIFGYGHLVLPQEEEFLKTHFGYETILDSKEKLLTPPIKPMSEPQKKEYIENLLLQDVEKVLVHMRETILVPLKQNQIDAILIYLFWRGANPLNEDVAYFYSLVNARDHKSIVNFMINKPKSDKNYLPGLKRRNQQTADLYNTGFYLFD